ncbi:MAG: alkylphosphonate utilization protein [Ilumatobacteraceae bacterium]|nr:alkylphosphonate utilization protein [Ilumatobacteraceae bacterium]
MDDVTACPICTMTELLDGGDSHECATCGHEWPKAESGERIVTDANGNQLNHGDDVTLIKDLKIKGKSGKLKTGTKIKGIRIVDGDHEIDCKVEGRPMLVKAEFVKLA